MVEDDWLISLDLAGMLEEHGFEVLGPASTVAAALLFLEGRRSDAAMLDMILGRGLITPGARKLCGRGVPFVLASGGSPADLGAEEALMTATNLGKPLSPMRLAAAVNEMVRRTGHSVAGDQSRL